MSVGPSDHPRVSRSELWWLGAALLLGMVLRLGFPGRIAIEHFDEGVYASNLWFGEQSHFEYPARFLYAPPLLPMVIEWTMIAASMCGLSPTGFIPMMPCLVAGLAMIPSMWWVGRRCFGPSAGLIAAWLTSVSDIHACYSRSAMTDIPVCLLILWGVYFGTLALRSGMCRDLFLSGLFTGLAWSTKYSGWLPLAITMAGGIAWQLTGNKREWHLAKLAVRWLTMAAVAGLVWSPVLYGLQRDGGYSAVAANHRQYVVGLAGWASGAIRQLTTTGLYDNWIGVLDEIWIVASSRSDATGPNLALDLLTSWNAGGATSRETGSSLLGRGLMMATPVVLLLTALAGCVACVWRNSGDRVLPAWILTAWICGLTVTTPTYHPYPRLALPWLIPVWLGVGLAVEVLETYRLGRRDSPASSDGSWNLKRVEVALISWLVACTVVRCALGTSHVWQDRSSVDREFTAVATQIKNQSKAAGYKPDEAIVFVLGEPAVIFTLKGNGLPNAIPVQDLSFLTQSLPRPIFFIRSERADRTANFAQAWDAHRSRFELVAEPTIRLSHLSLLDESGTFVDLGRRLKRGERFQVDRVK